MTQESEKKKFIGLLRGGAVLDCDLIIGGAEMPAAFVWDGNSQITDYGYEKYRPVLDADYMVLENGNIEIYCDDYRLGEEFCMAAAGFISDKEHIRIFGES